MGPATPFESTANCDGYYCSRCCEPKKDHVCHIIIGPTSCDVLVDGAPSPPSFSFTCSLPRRRIGLSTTSAALNR
ncbi:hypothetical protein OROMI_023558 [Orobanche minor]